MVRPRSTEAHEKVIHAALALFGERGIDTTSMDAIARASGVSKATIYNHWRDKEALLLEVMCHLHGIDRGPEDIDTGDIQCDIATVLNRRPPGELDQARMRLTPAFVAYSAFHPEFGAEWRHRVMEPPRQSLKIILRRGMERGALPSDLNRETSMAMLLGPILYNHIFSTRDPEKRKDIGAEVAEMFCRAYLQAEDRPKNR